MSNFTLQQLLTFDPKTALCIRINEILGSTLNPRYVTLTNLQPNSARRVTVRVAASQDLPNKDEALFEGQCDLSIDRLDIGDVVGGSLVLDYNGEILARDIGNHLTESAGIVFDNDDFTDQIITPTDNVLIMNPRSLRWYGQLTIIKK